MAKSFDSLVRRTTTKSVRQRASRRTEELLGELLVSELRQLSGKSQREMAALLGIKQPSVAKMERQTDLQISTLEKIVKALGGELEMVARFPNGAVRIRQPGAVTKRKGRSRPSPTELQLR